MQIASLFKLWGALVCLGFSAAFPFPSMFGLRGSPSRPRLFGSRSVFNPTRYSTGRKKPATRPFTIPGFESNNKKSKNSNTRNENLDFSLDFNGRALIDPIAGLYDPPAGGNGGTLSFVNGVGDFTLDRQSLISRAGLSDVGGLLKTSDPNQFINIGGSSGQKLGFITAANSRNVGFLDMNTGYDQPLDLARLSGDILGGSNQRSMDLSLQSPRFDAAGSGGGIGGLDLGSTDLVLLGDQIPNQLSMATDSQLGLGLSSLQGQLGLDINQIGGVGNNAGGGSQISMGDLLGGNQVSNNQLGMGGSAMDLGGGQMSGNQLSMGMGGGQQLSMGGSQLDLGGNQAGGNQVVITSSEIGGGLIGTGTSQMELGGNQLSGNQLGLSAGGLDMGLDMGGNQMDTGLLLSGNSLSLASGNLMSGQSLQDFGPGHVNLATDQVVGVSNGQLGGGLYQDTGLGVMPTQISLTNAQFLSPQDQQLQVSQDVTSLQGSQMSGASLGAGSSSQMQVNSPAARVSIATQLDSTAVGNDFGSPMIQSPLR